MGLGEIMDILGITLAGIGVLLASAGGIWFMITTFKKGLLWGLGNLFVPFVSLAFLCTHFKDAWKPSLINLVGAIMIGAGLAVFIPAHPELFKDQHPFQPPSPTDFQPAEQVR